GYIELAFQRETGPRPVTVEKLADFQARLDHLKVLSENITDVDNPVMPDDPEIAELQEAIAALQAEPEVVIREGLIIDFLQSTKVIPDKLTQSLVGFVGARHLTLEYMYSKEAVKESFSVDIATNSQGYYSDDTSNAIEQSANRITDDVTGAIGRIALVVLADVNTE